MWGGAIVSGERHNIMVLPMASGEGKRRSDRCELLREGLISPHPKKECAPIPRQELGREDSYTTPRERAQIGNVVEGEDSNRFGQNMK